MHKLGLAGGFPAEADIAPACLVIPGIRNGGNLLIAVHGGNQNLNIVGPGHGGGAVSRRQLHSAEVQAQAGNQIFGLADQLVKGRVGILGPGELEHLHLVELMAPDHAPLVGPVGTGLPAEAGGVGKEFLGKIGFRQNFLPVDGSQSGLSGGEHIVNPVIGGVRDLVDLVCKLGELACGFSALVLQHVGRKNELVAVGNVGIDEVVQKRPLQPRAHAGVHPVARAGQLHATLIVDKAQVRAKIHMVLGFKVKGMLLAHIPQGLVVLLAAGEQVGVREVGKAQHGGAVLRLQLAQFPELIGNILVQLDTLGIVGGDGGLNGGGVGALPLGLLLLAEKLTVFLGQLVLLGGLTLGGGLQGPDPLVQLQDPVNGGVAVHFLGFQPRLDGVGIFLDFFNVKHMASPFAFWNI